LLADDRPEQTIEDRGYLADPQFRPAPHQAGEAEFAGQPGKGGRFLVETKQTDDDGVTLDGGSK
jgi:hypothetical protein